MPHLTVDYFNEIKDYIHPNLHKIIKQYKINNVISLPPFHDCFNRNKNGTRKTIDYGRGHCCLTPSWNKFWKKNIKKTYFHNYPATRFLSNSRYRNLFRNKGNLVYNYNLELYVPIQKIPLRNLLPLMNKYKNALSQKA